MARVHLDTGRKEVEIYTDDMFGQKFLHLVFEALQALHYTPEDILRELKELDKENTNEQ